MIDLKFVADHAKNVILACNIPYLVHGQLVGSIFNTQSLLDLDNDKNEDEQLSFFCCC
jgi:hypothetical protein